MSEHYDNMPACSKCGRKTRLSYKPKDRPGRPPGCAPEECKAPEKCHAAVGIGVATLGADCHYEEGHLTKGVPHSFAWNEWSEKSCRYHKEGCP
jgi:hypothetical protein